MGKIIFRSIILKKYKSVSLLSRFEFWFLYIWAFAIRGTLRCPWGLERLTQMFTSLLINIILLNSEG